MQVSKETIVRPSVEATLVGLEGIVLRSGKSTVAIQRPSRVYFRNDGAVTVRSYSTGQSVRLSSFSPVVAWDKSGPVEVNLAGLSGPVFRNAANGLDYRVAGNEVQMAVPGGSDWESSAFTVEAFSDNECGIFSRIS